MVLTTKSFDERGGGKAEADEEVVEEAPVEEAADNSADIVKALEKVEKAQSAAEKALGKLGAKDLVQGVNRQRQDIAAAIAEAKKG